MMLGPKQNNNKQKIGDCLCVVEASVLKTNNKPKQNNTSYIQ